MLAAAVLRAVPLQSANDRSRWCTVWSLVERGTYQIDEIDRKSRFSTIDKVRHRLQDDQPWHFYSSKPPLLSTMVAGLYWIERHTLGMDLFAQTQQVTRLLLLIVNLLPMALALVSLRSTLRFLGIAEPVRIFVLAAAGFGSMLNPYLVTLNNHTPAAICMIFCISAIVRLEAVRQTATSGTASGSDLFLLGLCAAFSSCFELPSALFGVIAFLFAFRVSPSGTWKWFVPGALIPLAAFFVTNWICTGGLKPFYTWYGTDKYVYVHEGVASYWSNPKGLDANNEPWHVYLFHCVLGHHGLLSLTPVLFLSVAGWAVCLFRAEGPADDGSQQSEPRFPEGPGTARPFSRVQTVRLLRPVILCGMFLTLVTLSFYLTRTENYNYGGNSVALRWMLWLSPFWWYAMLPILDRVMAGGWKYWLCSLLLGASIISANWSQDRPWRPSWLFEAMESSGIINYRTPRAATGK